MSSKGKRLSESERLEVIAKLSVPSAPSKRSLAREYGVSEGAIRKIMKNKEGIQKRSSLMSDEGKRNTLRASIGRFSELEDVLYVWIDSMRRAKLPVPPSLVIVKAKRIAQQLSIPEGDFKASWQWLSRFRKRRGLQQILLHGEGAEVDKEDPKLLAALDDLYATISRYDPENVYNMDETGLFFRLLPRYTLLMPFEDLSTTRGKKKAKERVSLVVCANATGTHKLPCTMIGKPKSPACSKKRQWPIKYFSQGKAWMDVDTCWKWFNEVFYPEVKKRTGRPVLLLMDNAPGHFDGFERGNVKVEFFPPNCTSWKQPCDMGIIAALKKRYKYLYLKNVLDFCDLDESVRIHKTEQGKRLPRGAAGVAYGRPAHLLDAAHYVKQAWEFISATSIRNSFNKAQLLTPMAGGVDEEPDFIPELLLSFRALDIAIDNDELDEFMHIDDEKNEEYSEALLEDVNTALAAVQSGEDADTDDEAGPSNACDGEPVTNSVVFHGFDQLYNKVLEIEDQLLCPVLQEQAGDDYDKIKTTFESFQQKLRQVTLRVKQKKMENMRQLTLHDMMSNE